MPLNRRFLKLEQALMGEERAGALLNELLSASDLPQLSPETANRFEAYLALLMRWNGRLNLTAIRDEKGILSRHFLESIMCARAIPSGTSTLLDFGSGAGFPGIPIAVCRPEISVTLAESQAKKAAFLQEALRTLQLGNARVHSGRAEGLRNTFDCLVMRAVDRMEKAVGRAPKLISRGGWLVLMTTTSELSSLQAAAGSDIQWRESIGLLQRGDQVIALGVRRV